MWPSAQKNYRGITLTSVISKTLEIIILDRLAPTFENGFPILTQTAYRKTGFKLWFCIHWPRISKFNSERQGLPAKQALMNPCPSGWATVEDELATTRSACTEQNFVCMYSFLWAIMCPLSYCALMGTSHKLPLTNLLRLFITFIMRKTHQVVAEENSYSVPLGTGSSM